jgi:hypothetical protein
MPISVYCQECDKSYRVKDEQAGKRVRCPNGHILIVPAENPSVAIEPDELEVEWPVAPPPEIRATSVPRGDLNYNPYASPETESERFGGARELPRVKVTAPAVALIMVAVLGLGFSVYGVIHAMIAPPPPPMPANMDPDTQDFLRGFQEGSVGPFAAVLQAVFVGVNVLIIAGAIQMIRFKMWGLGLASSILAMVNFGNCCCLLGLPIGIWALVILLLSDVKEAFAQSA